MPHGELENSHLEVVKHAGMHYTEELRFWEVARKMGIMITPDECMLKMR
jgi:hypothetical protein